MRSERGKVALLPDLVTTIRRHFVVVDVEDEDLRTCACKMAVLPSICIGSPGVGEGTEREKNVLNTSVQMTRRGKETPRPTCDVSSLCQEHLAPSDDDQTLMHLSRWAWKGCVSMRGMHA